MDILKFKQKSILQQLRSSYQPKLPAALQGPVKVVEGAATQSAGNQEDIKALFPCTYGLPELTFVRDENATSMHSDEPCNVGVILSGGQAPGGHNVICGIFDGIKALNENSRLYGFLMGPEGLIEHDYKELTREIIDEYRNCGGFDMIGSGRTKLEKPEQFEKGLEIIMELNIKAIVIIGGDDSNTNAAVLAEYYKRKNVPVQVIGVPKTIDGDLKNEKVEISFGFDTATKLYSELIGNVERDCNSAKKYWHFIKLMGRSASHIALECALQTQPNYCVIGEEVAAKGMYLDDVVNDIARVVAARAAKGKNFGIVLIPEGLVEFMPAMKKLIDELNDILAENPDFSKLHLDEQREFVLSKLSPENKQRFETLPPTVARQLTLDRDPHGNVQLSLIETEKMLSEMVAKKLQKMKDEGRFVGKFKTQHHFFGYEGRCADPSNFDADYCYALGYNAVMLINAGATGYMSAIRHLAKPATEWEAGGIPITMMMNMERRRSSTSRENLSRCSPTAASSGLKRLATSIPDPSSTLALPRCATRLLAHSTTSKEVSKEKARSLAASKRELRASETCVIQTFFTACKSLDEKSPGDFFIIRVQ